MRRRAKPRPRAIVLLFEAQGGCCASCGGRMPALADLCLDQDRASIDHVEPRARGGTNDIANKLAMHRRCNSAKGDRAPTGCERIWHSLVLDKLGLADWRRFVEPAPASTLAEVWPG